MQSIRINHDDQPEDVTEKFEGVLAGLGISFDSYVENDYMVFNVGSESKTVEQICRDLLEIAVRDGIVRTNPDVMAYPHPQQMTSGDLVGMSNRLSEELRRHADTVSR